MKIEVLTNSAVSKKTPELNWIVESWILEKNSVVYYSIEAYY